MEAHDSRLNAFVLVGAPAARWRRREPIGPLDGVPVSIKDLLSTKGWLTVYGSKTTDAQQPGDDYAPAVAHLREAGAVIIGKTATPEFGHKGVTESLRHGITRNPWNISLTPGGSSGGAAAALAAGFGPLALGTDGGGSCRTPANFCRIVGMKPSAGCVPVWPPSSWAHLSTPGPMARCVEDVARLLTVVARPDQRDPAPRSGRVQDYGAGLGDGVHGLRCAFDLGFGSPVKREVRAVVTRAVERLAGFCALVEPTRLPVGDTIELFRVFYFAGIATTVASIAPERRALLEPMVREVAAAGERIRAVQYVDALRQASDLARRFHAFFQRFDLIVTETNAVAAFPVGRVAPDPDGEGDWRNFSPSLFPVNLAGLSAISLPCGRTPAGLPVGLQIIGPRGRDDLVLRAAKALELTTGLRNQLAPL
ncbi:MAG: amidase [Alphaproteobacteria bacterium]|nr:amidase [Alphaproteobacteria bacterium]